MDVRTVRRQLAALLPEARPTGEGEGTLELASSHLDAPRLISATVLEGSGPLRARRVFQAPVAGFRGFLDGTQRSVVADYLAGGAPIVVGTGSGGHPGAAEPPDAHLGAPAVRGADVRPTRGSCPGRHGRPSSGSAVTCWWTSVPPSRRSTASTPSPSATPPSTSSRPIARHWSDGSPNAGARRSTTGCSSTAASAAARRVAVSACTVGVVKTHRTLYAEGAALQTVLGLAHRERSSVFRITSTRRTTVASWYLRLRDPAGQRPDVGAGPGGDRASRPADAHAIGDRADEVSRWILAEAEPARPARRAVGQDGVRHPRL